MPRDLGDVIHYFIPEAAARREEASAHPPPRSADARERRAVVAIPVGDGDVLRAAFAWNLCVELARAGAEASLVAARDESSEAVWPGDGPGPLGCRVALLDRAPAAEIARTALAQAAERSGGRARCVLACVPELALREVAAGPDAPGTWLVLCAADDDGRRRAAAAVLDIARAAPAARIGATIHGVRSIAEARTAFDALASATDAAIPRPIASYGLVADDLHLYRAILSQRPVGLAHPQSPAARTLADVAALLVEDIGGAADA
ncbi:MAG: hypothetical protein R3E88_07525 [Myxococcota bacterium]